MRARNTKRKVLIVGAGPGGLAAAMLLARAGLDVTVLERRDVAGGRSATLKLGDFAFDTGPTFFLYPSVLQEIFAACGFDLWRELDLRRLEPRCRVAFGAGGELFASSDIEKLTASVARLNRRDAENVAAFMAHNRAKLAAMTPILQSPVKVPSDIVRLDSLGLAAMLQPHRSLASLVGGYFSDPRVRLAFTFQSKYLGMSPEQCPSLFSILPFIEHEAGVFHPRGGCGAVARRMAVLAQMLGAKLRFGETVLGLESMDAGPRARGPRAGRSTSTR